MKLELRRRWYTDISTTGELWIDGELQCVTLEDAVRDVKIKNETAIPYGLYEVTIDWSKRFDRPMPHILNVPNFDGIRIHSGNTDKDTEGCVLVGLLRGVNYLGRSRDAFNIIFPKLQAACDAGDDITIDIVDGRVYPDPKIANEHADGA